MPRGQSGAPETALRGFGFCAFSKVPFRDASGGVRGRSNRVRGFSGGLREGVGEGFGSDLGGPEGSISVFLSDVSIFQKTCSR